MQAEGRGKRKEREGTVVSAKMDKTVVVNVSRKIRHPKYNKIVVEGKKFYAHDENNSAKEGDTVTIVETRPLSKSKRFRVTNVVSKEEAL